MNDEEFIAKYEGAKAIYALNRRKKSSGKAKLLDFAVCLFTPLAGVTDEVDYFTDMGDYYLVDKGSEQLLVRVHGEEITEEVVTGKIRKKSDKVFVYNKNQFAFCKDLISGKSMFTLNI